MKEKRWPDPWKISVVIPLFKKGDASLCENYRPISLGNCLGKILDKILNKRLELWLDERQILREEQAGFRKGYSPSDRMFVLNALISKYCKGNGKLYVAFLDLSRAFDNVDRITLFRTLLRTGIPSPFLRVLLSMYCLTRNVVKTAGSGISRVFFNVKGVKQGSTLSPKFLLFL